MGYTQALQNLMTLSAQAFAEIPEFGNDARDVILTNLQPATHMKSREQAWLMELCKSLGTSKQMSEEMCRPFPRFLPHKALKRGGEAFLILAYDQWRDNFEVLLKVPLPRFSMEKTQEHKIDAPAETQEKPGVVQGLKAMLGIGRAMCKPNQKRNKTKAEPLYEPRKDKYDDTYSFTRFKRSFILQKQLHKLSRREGGDLGYIPDVYEYTEPPQCFYSMEFVANGCDYLEWVKTHTDEQNIEMFLRLVGFLEKVLHGYGVAHCDLAPRNILIRDNVPVLLDFGIAKAKSLQDITAPGQQMGSPLFSSVTQMNDGAHRSYQDDIFSLGRMLWITLCRRIPSTDYIVAREIDGKVEVDMDAIAALFHLSHMPKKFQGIYQATQDFEYEDISDFRQALESVLCLAPTTCLEKCKYLIELEEKLESVGKLLEQVGMSKTRKLMPIEKKEQ